MRTLAPLFAAAITAVLVVAVFQVHSRLTATPSDDGVLSVAVTVGPEPTPLATARRSKLHSGYGSGHHHPGCTAHNWRSKLNAAERFIYSHESSLNPAAREPTTGAYGLGQLLPSTYRNLGLEPSADPCEQVAAARAYMHRRYGNWQNALEHWRAASWW